MNRLDDLITGLQAVAVAVAFLAGCGTTIVLVCWLGQKLLG